MLVVVSIALIVALFSVVDFLKTKEWQMVTSANRNELIFKNRNQEYGAYRIRRDYNRNMLWIMFGMLLSGFLLIGMYKLYRSSNPAVQPDQKVEVENQTIEVQMDLAPVQQAVVPEVKLPAEKRAGLKVEQQKTAQLLAPVASDKKQTTELINPDLSKDKIGGETKDGKEGGSQQVSGNGGSGSVNRDSVVVKPTPPTSDIVDVPDVDAAFPGGYTALYAFIQKQLVLDQAAAVDGKCYVRFVVNEKGKISSVKVINGIKGCPECNEAVLNVVNKMPVWIPAQVKGKNVKSYFVLPVKISTK